MTNLSKFSYSHCNRQSSLVKFVYNIPYRRARALGLAAECAREQRYIAYNGYVSNKMTLFQMMQIHSSLQAAAIRLNARNERVSYIQNIVINGHGL